LNSDLLNVLKNLNKPDYILVLEEIGKSDRPINRYKLMKNLGKTTYIYDIIDELCPSEEYIKGPYLFDLDDINDDNHNVTFKRNLIQKLNQVYRLQWKLPDKNDELNIDGLVRLKKTEEGKSTLIWIYHGEQNSVHIRFGFNKPISNEAIITIYDNGNKVDLKNDNRLFIIQNKKTSKSKRKNKDAILSFYIRKYYPKHKWYLDVILSEKVKEQEANPKVKKYWEYFKYVNSDISKIPDTVLCEIISDDDCMKIIRNKEYWEYRLIFVDFCNIFMENHY
jgi:hypothetical protein